MLDVVEKTKKALSSDTDALIQLDNFHEDYELDDSIERNLFEELIQPHTQKLTNFLI